MDGTFFRVLFGNPWSQDHGHRHHIVADLAFLNTSRFDNATQKPFVVFGKENRDRLDDLGFKCLMVERRPMPFSGKSLLCNKLLACETASPMFRDAVFLDIDCHQIAPLPGDFWDACRSKGDLQIPLYRKWYSPAKWRTDEDGRKYIPCSCYVYMRGSNSTKRLTRLALRMIKDGHDVSNDEIVFAMHIDLTRGGWRGVAEYAKVHEPKYYHRWCKMKTFRNQTPVFCHYGRAAQALRALKAAGVDCRSEATILKAMSDGKIPQLGG